ncbi:MAG: putative TPR repeat methyltransferase [Crocinitomicaceae bacterium]|jgi:predicted TPR repeat methyltransferase
MDQNKNAVEIFNKLAEAYQEKFMNVDLYANSFQFLSNAISIENPEILELACGPGNITKFLLNIRPDFKILGTDLSSNMIELAKVNNPSAEFKIMDSRETFLLKKSFDAVICGFLLPYLSKEESIQLIQNSASILHPNGLLYISTMEDECSKSGFTKGSSGDQIFMHYHQADYLTEAIKSSGLEVLKTERIETKNEKGTVTVDLILIAKKI